MRYLWLFAVTAAFAQNPMQEAIAKQQAAIAQQRESIRKQAASAAVWLVPWDPAPAISEPPCDRIADPVVAPIIEDAAKAQQLEPKLLRAVIEQESGYHACAVSPKGAMGLMQLMPPTVDELKVSDPFDPKQSIDAGAKFLKQLLDRYKGDLPQALGAYNAGPATVDQAGGIPDIPETREYVDAILAKMGITRTVQPSSPKPKPTGN
jgi:soluble lytic murein transglycosylase-like protein